MPQPLDILRGLSALADQAFGLAIAWHLALAALALCVLVGWRPARRSVALLSVLPLISVSLLAWAFGNPFNGSVFALLAVGLAVSGARLGRAPAGLGPIWARAAGIAMIAFGWCYPHFLAGATPLTYVYAAPVGLIPCPTLSLLVGVALVVGGMHARGWSLTLALAGIGYGLFGALRLGVAIDLGLLFGAVLLAALVLGEGRTRLSRIAVSGSPRARYP